MIVQVDLYTDSGKWKYGGRVDIEDVNPWYPDFKREVYRRQTFVQEGTMNRYYVVVRTMDDDEGNVFVNRMYHPIDMTTGRYL